MKKFLSLFKPFFCTSNRIIVSTIVLILVGIKIFNSGFANFLSFAFEIFVALIGALLLTFIDTAIYVGWKFIWYKDTDNEPYENDDIATKEFELGMFFANTCAILYLVYKGTVVWQ